MFNDVSHTINGVPTTKRFFKAKLIFRGYKVTRKSDKNLYSASYTGTKPDQPALQSSEVAVDRQESMVLQRYCGHPLNADPRQQLANTPSPQSTTPGLHPVSIHQMAPLKRTSNCSLLLICCRITHSRHNAGDRSAKVGHEIISGVLHNVTVCVCVVVGD